MMRTERIGRRTMRLTSAGAARIDVFERLLQREALERRRLKDYRLRPVGLCRPSTAANRSARKRRRTVGEIAKLGREAVPSLQTGEAAGGVSEEREHAGRAELVLELPLQRSREWREQQRELVREALEARRRARIEALRRQAARRR